MKSLRLCRSFLLPLLAGMVLTACVQTPAPVAVEGPTAPMPSGPPPQAFDSPADAVKALLAATQAKDQAAVRGIFGPAVVQLLADDPAQDAVELDNFSKQLAQMCNPVAQSADKV